MPFPLEIDATTPASGHVAYITPSQIYRERTLCLMNIETGEVKQILSLQTLESKMEKMSIVLISEEI